MIDAERLARDREIARAALRGLPDWYTAQALDLDFAQDAEHIANMGPAHTLELLDEIDQEDKT